MKIGVTGSSGFIGTAVKARLAEHGHEIVAFDHPYDVRRFTDLRDIFGRVDQVDGIIHLEGALGTTEIFGAEHEAVTTNICGAVNVYDFAAQNGIPVVQIGTGHKGQPNPYAITKACAEDLGLARARYRNEKINVVRAFHVYGPGQKAVPPFGKGTVRKIMPSFICRALKNLPLEVYGSGLQVIDLVHVDDVARVLVNALTQPYGQLLEAGTGKPTTVLDAARTVIRYTDSKSKIVHLPMRDGEPEDATVIAGAPLCHKPWPYQLAKTIDYYYRSLED